MQCAASPGACSATTEPSTVMRQPWLPVLVTTTTWSSDTSGPIVTDRVNGAEVSSGTRPPGSRSMEYTVPDPVTSKRAVRDCADAGAMPIPADTAAAANISAATLVKLIPMDPPG